MFAIGLETFDLIAVPTLRFLASPTLVEACVRIPEAGYTSAKDSAE